MGEVSQRWSGSVAKLRVLVTNDGAESANLLATQLGELGCSVRFASDGSSALRQAISFRPNLVLLDLGLARLDGFELARAIRRHVALEETTLIAVTAFHDDFYRRVAAEAGFHRYLRKPYDFERLAEVISSVRRFDASLGHAAE
jgi:two-component system, sensor histidine kinase